jgi:hypothetical protein
MKGIRLHKEHGLNPTIPQCFFCGKDKDEIVLLGAAYKEEAPMKMCVDQIPCDECKKLMEMGVLLISVQDGSNRNNPYRTGKLVVITQEVAKRVFNNIGESRVAFIEESAWQRIGLPEKKKVENVNNQ